MMLDDMAVELIGRDVFLQRRQHELVARHEGKQAAAPPAQRTVAVEPRIEFALHLKGDGTAMAASLVFHPKLPLNANP
jgi:hypothetical protein